MLDNEIFIVLLYFMLKLCGCGETGRRAGLRNQCLRRGGSSPLIRTNNIIYNQSENKIWLIFLSTKKVIQSLKERSFFIFTK